MSLADFTPETAVILRKGKPLMTVRGLNTDDIAWVLEQHLADAERIYELWQAAGADIFTTVNADNLILNLITQAPGLAANIVATAADERAMAEKVRQLPAALQVNALVEIMRMTFEDVGGPKAFFASLGAMVQKSLPNLMGTDTKIAA